jgi:hypothetical protein
VVLPALDAGTTPPVVPQLDFVIEFVHRFRNLRVAAINDSATWRRILARQPGPLAGEYRVCAGECGAGDGPKDRPEAALFLAEALGQSAYFRPMGGASENSRRPNQQQEMIRSFTGDL